MTARILLVEDDADLRDVMAAALTADGHDVQTCADGRAALDALSEGAPEVVLLDVVARRRASTASRSAGACAPRATTRT